MKQLIALVFFAFRDGNRHAREQTPEALAALQQAEINKWWPIIEAAGIKPE